MEVDGLRLNALEYLHMPGLDVMLAHDFYPEGHQGGVGWIQHGRRAATNGDLRPEPTPGQWSPIPKVGTRQVNRETGEISVRMEYPDESRDRKGFNPIEYPDLHFAYTLRVRPEGRAFRIAVDLEAPLPLEWQPAVGFNLELYPGDLFGKTYQLDGQFGLFPRQANGPGFYDDRQSYQIAPLAKGRRLVVAPEYEEQRVTIEAVCGGEIELIDGRGLHTNGWFVVRSLLDPGRTESAMEWLVTPNVIENWLREPVIQVSQVGYHPAQQKIAVIELDAGDPNRPSAQLERIEPDGAFTAVIDRAPADWGTFLRYRYLRFDFSEVAEQGMYRIRFGNLTSAPFAIDPAVYERHVWQPTVDCFLPVQMCHMRVNDGYRVWHGCCHMDDARMAPVNHNHFDGYVQGPSTLTTFAPGQHVPGLDAGGWHDAGDYDLRVESQCDTFRGLALAYEEFRLDYDNTTIDQVAKIVELHRPDGKPDVLQQVEHGALSVVGGYRALGRLYRGIIEPTLRQYTHLGDASTVTDNRVGSSDDRWVFTEENPGRELDSAAALAAAARVLPEINGPLAQECLDIARSLYERTRETEPLQRLAPAVELLIATGDSAYAETIVGLHAAALQSFGRHGWLLARAAPHVSDAPFHARLREAVAAYLEVVEGQAAQTPYGVPYEPSIWGAGWGIQAFGARQYWLHKQFPEVFPARFMLHALNFVLGCHPGSNTASFVSGVGAKSLIPGYGVNRADFSYIPGGVGSGTALIRPDFPELLEWPFLWQQTEYCLGGPTADYVFLVAAAAHPLGGE